MCGVCARQFWQVGLAWNRTQLAARRAVVAPPAPSPDEQAAMVDEIYHTAHWQAEQHRARRLNPETKQAARCARAADKLAALRVAVAEGRAQGWSRWRTKQALKLHEDTMQVLWPTDQARKYRPTAADQATVRDLLSRGLRLNEIQQRTGMTERRIRTIRQSLRQAVPSVAAA